MAPTKKKDTVVLVCNKCGKTDKRPIGKEFKLKETIEHEPFEVIPVVDDSAEKPSDHRTSNALSAATRKQGWWTQQTRSSDEPETRFYRCMKCKKTWREYS